MDEWARAGDGHGFESRLIIRVLFFSSHLRKFSKFFGGLIAGTRSTKFPVPVPVR